MRTNEIPAIDLTDNETGCCPRFHPEPWEHQELHFEGKPFVRASTASVMHVPINMGRVFARTWKLIKDAGADAGGHFVLSRDRSPWRAEHLFAVSKDVPGADMVRVSGDFVTRVFEGPFSDEPKWCKALQQDVHAAAQQLSESYFFHTTCPRCAKHYGRNYVVGLAKLASPRDVDVRSSTEREAV